MILCIDMLCGSHSSSPLYTNVPLFLSLLFFSAFFFAGAASDGAELALLDDLSLDESLEEELLLFSFGFLSFSSSFAEDELLSSLSLFLLLRAASFLAFFSAASFSIMAKSFFCFAAFLFAFCSFFIFFL